MQKLEKIKNQIDAMHIVLALLSRGDEMNSLAGELNATAASSGTHASDLKRSKAFIGVYKELSVLNAEYMRQLRLITTFKKNGAPECHKPYTEVGF